MTQENLITLRGYVTAEPKFWLTASTRTPVAEIRIGSTPRRLNRATGEWEDADTTYYTVKCWRRLAVNVAGSLRKGDMVIVRGKFVTRQWVDDQQRTRVRIDVEADTVGHDLMFGWAHFIRGVHAPQPRTEPGPDGELGRQDMAASPGDLSDVSDPGDMSDPVDRDGRDDPGIEGDGDELAVAGVGAGPVTDLPGAAPEVTLVR